jgi:hypothetical protein
VLLGHHRARGTDHATPRLSDEQRGPRSHQAVGIGQASASCNFLFGSNGAGTASRYSCWGGPSADTHSAGGAAPFCFRRAVAVRPPRAPIVVNPASFLFPPSHTAQRGPIRNACPGLLADGSAAGLRCAHGRHRAGSTGGAGGRVPGGVAQSPTSIPSQSLRPRSPGSSSQTPRRFLDPSPLRLGGSGLLGEVVSGASTGGGSRRPRSHCRRKWTPIGPPSKGHREAGEVRHRLYAGGLEG